jgi:hypothetical protein
VVIFDNLKIDEQIFFTLNQERTKTIFKNIFGLISRKLDGELVIVVFPSYSLGIQILHSILDFVFLTFLRPQDINPKYLGDIASLCKECSSEIQFWWAKYLEDLPLPPSIVPKNMHDDLWLEIHFLEMIHDKVISMCCVSILLTI